MIKVQYPPQQQGKIQFSTFVSRCVDIFHIGLGSNRNGLI